jgi:addiction module HigA family antidote
MHMHNPAHPGKILAYYMAEHSVTGPALSRVLHGRTGVSADMALRLGEALGTEPDLWLRLQMQRDLWEASQKKRPKVKPFPASAAA